MASFVHASPATEIKFETTKWDLCFICQTKQPKSVKLVTPANKRGFDAKNSKTHGSYTTIAKSLHNWMDVDEFPTALWERITYIHKDPTIEIHVALKNAFVSKMTF